MISVDCFNQHCFDKTGWFCENATNHPMSGSHSPLIVFDMIDNLVVDILFSLFVFVFVFVFDIIVNFSNLMGDFLFSSFTTGSKAYLDTFVNQIWWQLWWWVWWRWWPLKNLINMMIMILGWQHNTSVILSWSKHNYDIWIIIVRGWIYEGWL